MSRGRVTWKCVVWALCISGFVAQAYYITSFFCRHETVNEVIVNRASNVRPPKLAICTDAPLQQIVNATALSVLKVATFANGSHMTLVFPPVAHQALHIESFRRDANMYCFSLALRANISVDTHFHGFLPWMMYYLHITFKPPVLHGNHPWYARRCLSPALLTIFFTFPISSSRLIFTIAEHLRLYGDGEDALNLESGAKNLHKLAMSYTYYRSETLPHPYNTDCFDYRSIGKESRAQAYEDCYRAAVWEARGKVPCDVLHIGTTNNSMLINNNILPLLKRKCRERWARRDCVADLFLPRIVHHWEGTLSGVLNVVAPSRPQIVTISRPKIENIDYVTYMLSCVSFWFAFSPLCFLADCVLFKCVRRKLRRCCSSIDIADASSHEQGIEMQTYASSEGNAMRSDAQIRVLRDEIAALRIQVTLITALLQR